VVFGADVIEMCKKRATVYRVGRYNIQICI